VTEKNGSITTVYTPQKQPSEAKETNGSKAPERCWSGHLAHRQMSFYFILMAVATLFF